MGILPPSRAFRPDFRLQESFFQRQQPPMTSRPPTISLVVPAYDSARSLPELIARLTPVLARVSSEFEILLVNDGSRDNTWRIISELAERCPAVMGINLMRNYGQHNALLAGIRLARYELVVT